MLSFPVHVSSVELCSDWLSSPSHVAFGVNASLALKTLSIDFPPVLLVEARRVQGDGALEHRHGAVGDLGVQRGVCVDERLDQLCGGARFLLRGWGTVPELFWGPSDRERDAKDRRTC